MKEKFKTPEFQDITDKLDKAIDNMDTPEVEKLLSKISEYKPVPEEIEDSRLFAKRIIKQNKKGQRKMKKNTKIIALASCLVLTIGITAVYATGLFERFKFYNDKTTVEVRTNQDLSEEEIEELAKEAEESYNSPIEQANIIKSEKEYFSSIEEAEKATGIEIILPSYIPADFQMDKEIMINNNPNDNYNIYVTYTSQEDENRRLGVTIITQNLIEDTTSVTVTDAVHEGEYKTPSGTKYSILKEGPGTIATIDVDNIQYALIFAGVNEKEMYKVIDSADLNGYTK